MPKKKKPSAASTSTALAYSENLQFRLDEFRSVDNGLCLMCERNPRAYDSFTGRCRQCTDAGKIIARQARQANKAMRGMPVTATLMSQEGQD